MSRVRFTLMLLLIAALLSVAVNVQAQGTPVFFCVVADTPNGDGSFEDPWECITEDQLQGVFDTICVDYGFGTLVRINQRAGYYDIYEVFFDEEVQECTSNRIGRLPYNPPTTGVDLPAPLLYGGTMAVGVVLVAVGFFIRRKKNGL